MYTYSNKLILCRLLLLPASQYSYPRLLRSNMLLMCAFVNLFPMWPHTGCASSLYAQSSSLSGIRTLQQSFTYPNYFAAVFQVSKPCSSLSGIQTLQQYSLSGIQIKPWTNLTLRNQTLQQPNSFTYPNLTSSSLKDVPQVRQITDFKLCYTRNTHYDSVVALDGDLCSEFPTLQTSAVETDTIVVQNYFVVWLIMHLILLTSTHRIS